MHTQQYFLVFGVALEELIFLLDKHIWRLHWVKCKQNFKLNTHPVIEGRHPEM